MTQSTLFSEEEYIFHLARTKYSRDWAVQVWLEVYERGTPPVVVKNSRKRVKIEGIKPRSEFALRGLIKAIRLREEGKVMR